MVSDSRPPQRGNVHAFDPVVMGAFTRVEDHVGYRFDEFTSVTRQGRFEYVSEFDPSCTVGDVVNGGYLIATTARAAQEAVREELGMVPVSVSTNFIDVVKPGPAQFQVEVLRMNARSATALVRVQQEDALRLVTTVALGDLPEAPQQTFLAATPLELPPRENCVDASSAPPAIQAMAPMMQHLDLLFDPEGVMWTVGAPSGQGHIRGWMRLADGREPDAFSLLMASDALPPATFDLGLNGWAPTLQMTVHLRARPSPGWLRVSHRTTCLSGGRFEEDCEIWDSENRLVAQSRQFAGVPRVRHHDAGDPVSTQGRS